MKKLSAKQQETIENTLLQEGWYIIESGISTVFSKLGCTDYYVLEENKLRLGTIERQQYQPLVDVSFSKFKKEMILHL